MFKWHKLQTTISEIMKTRRVVNQRFLNQIERSTQMVFSALLQDQFRYMINDNIKACSLSAIRVMDATSKHINPF